jgi:uncharacterized protein
LEAIAQRLFKEMATRLRRRMKSSRKLGVLDLNRTIRRSIATGGECVTLMHRNKKPKKKRLIVLLDVSGSMDKYSFYLLRFVCTLQQYFRQVEAFVFSTTLKRISKVLHHKQLEYTLGLLADQVDHWSSGTRIGECLESFVEKYGKRMLNGSPVVIILSDGLDTGQPQQLSTQMHRIQQRAGRTIWLNPLKGTKDYQPIARGMSEAMPWIDDFSSAHNLHSLLELEKIMSYA